MVPGERFVEWCWYDTCDNPSPVFTDYMTDRKGHRHNMTVPAELLRPEVWKAQLFRRDASLPEFWRQSFSRSSLPLLTAIRSFENAKASFFGGKLLLVGEAYTQIRPHLGASCDIAAIQAINLPQVLDGSMSIGEWETIVGEYAMEKAMGSKATGTFGMTGRWPDGYVPAFAKQ